MKLAVAVKCTGTLDDEFALQDDGSGVVPDHLDYDLNEWDIFSLEAAVQLREQAGGGEVVAIAVGGEKSERALRSCLAKGGDRAVRISVDDPGYDDPLAVARILASAVARESPALVLCGVQSSDAANAATGIALAGYLDLPHVAVVKRLEYDFVQSVAIVERELEGGVVELLRVRAPALLTIQTGINKPRYANLRAIKQAGNKPLEVITPAELGLDESELAASAGAKLRALRRPDRGAGAEMIAGSAADVAARIAQIARERMPG